MDLKPFSEILSIQKNSLAQLNLAASQAYKTFQILFSHNIEECIFIRNINANFYLLAALAGAFSQYVYVLVLFLIIGPQLNLSDVIILKTSLITMISDIAIQSLLGLKKAMLLLFAALSLVAIEATSQQNIYSHDIILLNKQNFLNARSQFQYLFVYFFSQNCHQCAQSSQLFYILHSLTNSKNTENPTAVIQYAEMELRENEQLFETEQIEAVPLFRMYKKDSQPETYQLITPSYQTLYLLEAWVHRVIKRELQHVASLVTISGSLQKIDKKWVLVNCNDKQLTEKLLSSKNYLINLQIAYGCLENNEIRSGKVLLIHKQFINLLSDCQDDELSWTLCQNSITNFRFRGLVHLSDQIIHQIYHRNMSLIIAVTSNNSQSHNIVLELSNLKYQIQNKQSTEILPIFVIADLNYNIEETMRMKKFIGGYELQGTPHPYPILAYLWLNKNGTIIKYIYETKYYSSTPSNQSIQQWYQSVKFHNLSRDLRNRFGSADAQFFKNDHHTISKINLNQLLILLDEIKMENDTKPKIFLYVNWRTSWQMQVILSKLRKWWSSSKIDAHILHLDMYDNELPSNIQLKYLPGLITFYDDWSYQIKQNITSCDEIIQHINGLFKNNKAS